jgi:outer membrane protein TolC
MRRLAVRRFNERQERAVTSSKDSLQLFTIHYRCGVDTCLQVTPAEATELLNAQIPSDTLRRRMDASVPLGKALGGGWDISDAPTLGAGRVKDY